MRTYCILHLLIGILLFEPKAQDYTPLYEIPYLPNNEIHIDGIAGIEEWKGASNYSLIKSIGADSTPHQETEVKMLWNDCSICILYKVRDTNIKVNTKTHDGPVYYDDCVEVFFSLMHAIDSFYVGFEMNAEAVYYDFIFMPHKIDSTNIVIPTYNPVNIQISTRISGTANHAEDVDEGWVHEVCIPYSAFRGISVKNEIRVGTIWRFQLSRWDYQNDQAYFSSLTKTGQNSPHVFEKMPYLKFIDNSSALSTY